MDIDVQMRRSKHTKDGVDDMMCVFQVRFEILGERDVEILELGS